MSDHYDIIVIGSGPAGMAAAQTAAKHGAKTLVIDEQTAPGGQIFRAIEKNAKYQRPELGKAYSDGLRQARAFRDSGVEYANNATVWQLSEKREVGYSSNGSARLVSADQVIVAGGAQERPVPVSGWTLPGVMTVGAAQILLKESSIGIENAVFAGTGPLLYLVAQQYIAAGIPIKAILDLTPQENYRHSLAHLPGALMAFSKLLEGWQWKRAIEQAGTLSIDNISDLKIGGAQSATHVEYCRNGSWQQLECEHVLLHQGVVPNVNISLAAGCDSYWDETQLCWNIVVDERRQSSIPGIFVAGDGAFIGGAIIAEQSGHIAALAALMQLKKISETQRDSLARPHQKILADDMRIRPFLNALFKPSKNFRIPGYEDTIVCRCEEVTAGQVREVVDLGCPGPNQMKSFSRCGMGPCQGRFCGLTVSELIADKTGKPVADIGYYRLRPPIKPLSLGELANLNLPESS